MNEIITLAGGCFWCTEAVFNKIKGIISVTPGYAGGFIERPSYEEVCMGKTGHTEAVNIVFDPNIISMEELLDIYWYIHDPTTKDRQGNDVGPQYRSVIFYRTPAQRKIAEKSRIEIDNQKIYKDPVVTEILPFTNFYGAEEYHMNYYENNQNAPYCKLIIDPKLQKFTKMYKSKLKSA